VAEEEKETPEKKGSPLIPVLIGVIVLVLIFMGFIAWKLFLTPKADENVDETILVVDEVAEVDETATYTYGMETFVVNLNDPGGKRYLKTNIELEYTSETLGDELVRRLPQLRDLILLLLSSKSLDDIQSVDGKIALRRELIQRINQTLTGGKIRNLYFTQFVIQ
jgi:flagellar FliL protein